MNKVFTILALLFFSAIALAQSEHSKVSLIGDNEVAYEALISECSSLLLTVSGNSMDNAYEVWSDMLSTMEDEASNEGLDLKGVKIWVNLFWKADGSINKIAYYPKPNSKNMDFTKVTAFLESFADSYQLPLTHNVCFSHYGSASFPVHTKLSVNNAK